MARKSYASVLLERLPESNQEVIIDTVSHILQVENPVLRRLRAESSRYSFREEYIFQKREDGFFFGQKTSNLHIQGNRLFTKGEWRSRVILEGNRLTVKSELPSDLAPLFRMAGVEWASRLYLDCPNESMTLFCKSTIVKGILFGKIRSLKDIYRTYARSCGLKTVDWRVFRDYLEVHTIPFSDIIDGTTDPVEAMRFCIEHPYNEAFTLRDTVRQAVILGRRVNPRWSIARLNREHIAYTAELMNLEREALSDNPIYDEDSVAGLQTDGMTVLNTESDVFREAETQSHCLYTNYLNRILSKSYVPMHASVEGEEATFGVVPSSEGGVLIDQVRLSHNRLPSSRMMDAVRKFVDEKKEIFGMLLEGQALTGRPAVAYDEAVLAQMPF